MNHRRAAAVVFVLSFTLLLAGCEIDFVFGPAIVKHGEEVGYNVLIGESRTDDNVTMYLTADVPAGWSLKDAVYRASIASGTAGEITVHETDPGVIVGLPPVASGYQRVFFSAGVFPLTIEGDKGTAVLEFTVAGAPGDYELGFWAGFTSDSGSDQGGLKTFPVRVLPPDPAGTLLADGFELGDTSAWSRRFGPEPALVAHYKLDGNANDSSGKGNHGTPIGGPTPAEDRFGRANKALLFDGANDHIIVPDSDTLDLQRDFSFAAWIRPTATPNGVIFQKGETVTGSPVYTFDIGGGIVQGAFAGQPTSGWTEGCFPIQQDVWQLLVVTYDQVNLLAYVDGVIEGQKDMNGPFLVIGDEVLEIGSYQGSRFSGVMDDIRIMHRALSFGEVQQLLR